MINCSSCNKNIARLGETPILRTTCHAYGQTLARKRRMLEILYPNKEILESEANGIKDTDCKCRGGRILYIRLTLEEVKEFKHKFKQFGCQSAYSIRSGLSMVPKPPILTDELPDDDQFGPECIWSIMIEE